VGKPLVPNAFAHERGRHFLAIEYVLMHTDDQDLFVIRPVEDAYAPALWQTLGVAPHEIMIEVFTRWLLERKDLTALWIYARHHMFDRPVLAGCIHRLKDEQQRPAVLRVKHFLLLSEPNGAALKQFGRFSFFQLQSAGVAGIEVFQPKILAFG